MAYKSYDISYRRGQSEPFKVSRSKIDFFLECPRCFWLDRVLAIKRPNTPPFQINKAVDELLKNEFDIYRAKGEPHPYMTNIDMQAVPYQHKDLDKWRHNFTGIQTVHKPTNLLVFGAVDDIWINEAGELIVVDYKVTSKNKPITDLDPPGGWHDAYRRQMEVYQWLLRQNGFKVSDTGYFVYANGIADAKRFDEKVVFKVNTFPYTGDSSWVDGVLEQIKQTLEQPTIPKNSPSCTYCSYTAERLQLAWDYMKQKNTDK